VKVRNAAVHPEHEIRKLRLQPADDRLIARAPLDRIDVGHIERGERMEREEPAGHVHGIAGRRQRRHDRPVPVALAHAGAHHHSALQVDDRDDLHDALASPPRKLTLQANKQTNMQANMQANMNLTP
jgi:hypothetical protein